MAVRITEVPGVTAVEGIRRRLDDIGARLARLLDHLIDFLVYDPNDPAVPGTIRFDAEARRFWSTRVYNTSVGPIRAFRMYFSPLL